MITLVSAPSMTKTSLAAGPSCEQVLDSCDAALKAKQRELDLSDLGVKIRDEDRQRLLTENRELRSQGSSFWTNPFLWATIGLFVGSRVTR